MADPERRRKQPWYTPLTDVPSGWTTRRYSDINRDAGNTRDWDVLIPPPGTSYEDVERLSGENPVWDKENAEKTLRGDYNADYLQRLHGPQSPAYEPPVESDPTLPPGTDEAAQAANVAALPPMEEDSRDRVDPARLAQAQARTPIDEPKPTAAPPTPPPPPPPAPPMAQQTPETPPAQGGYAAPVAKEPEPEAPPGSTMSAAAATPAVPKATAPVTAPPPAAPAELQNFIEEKAGEADLEGPPEQARGYEPPAEPPIEPAPDPNAEVDVVAGAPDPAPIPPPPADNGPMAVTPGVTPPPPPASEPDLEALYRADLEKRAGEGQVALDQARTGQEDAQIAQIPGSPESQALAPLLKGEDTDLKPDWYKDEAPPNEMLWAKVLLGLATSGVLAGLAPDQKSALAAGLGGLLQTGGMALGAPTRNYNRRLAAADTQSQMMARQQNAERQRAGGASARVAEAKQKYEDDMNNRNSEASKSWHKVAEGAGWGKNLPNPVNTYTGNELKNIRVQAAQRDQQGRQFAQQNTQGEVRQERALERMDYAELKKRETEARAENRQLSEEERSRIAELEKTDVPGQRWASGRAPNTQTVVDAHEFVQTRDAIATVASRLAENQEKISAWQQLGGPLSKYFGTEDQKQIMADMMRDVQTLDGYMRSKAALNMGVPQRYELEILKEINPKANSLDAFFIGKYAWRSLANGVPELADIKLRSIGSIPESEPLPEERQQGTKKKTYPARRPTSTTTSQAQYTVNGKSEINGKPITKAQAEKALTLKKPDGSPKYTVTGL